jgi:hypothetical protein
MKCRRRPEPIVDFWHDSALVPTGNPRRVTSRRESGPMSDVCRLIWHAVAGLFRSRAALQAEILVLRHQLNVLHRSSPRRVALSNVDRLVFVGLYRVAATVLDALKIVQPETTRFLEVANPRRP